MDASRWTNVILSTGAMLTAGGFAVLYARVRWWRTQEGLTIMALTGAFILLALYTPVITAWPESSAFRYARSALMGVMILVWAQLIRLLLRAQRTRAGETPPQH